MYLKGCLLVNYVLQRSLGAYQKNRCSVIPSFKMDVNMIDTPDKALRKEVLVGTISSWPFYLVSIPKNKENMVSFTHIFENGTIFEDTISETVYSQEMINDETHNDADIHLWCLSLGQTVQLVHKITFGPLFVSDIPIVSLATIWDTENQALTQILLRKHQWIVEEAESVGGGWIEMRQVQLKPLHTISNMKSIAVPAGEESIYNNACFSYLKYGLIPVLTNTRLIFFPYYHTNNWNEQTFLEDKMWPSPSSFELKVWSNNSSQEPSPIVFELDLYIEKLLKETNCGSFGTYLDHFHTEFIPSYERKIDSSSMQNFEGVTIIAGGLGKTVLIVTRLQITPWKRYVVPFHTKIWTLKNPVRTPIKAIQAGFSFMLGKKHKAHNCRQYCIGNEYKLMEFYQNDGLEDIQISSELGQYLLSEYKTYTKNTEYREKLFKLEISRLKARINQTVASLVSHKKRNKELEEEISKVNEKNKNMLNHMEDLNASLYVSKFHIENLSTALQATKEIETMDIESTNFLSIMEKQYLSSFVKELITKNSLLKKAYTELYNTFLTQNGAIQLQPILLQPFDNSVSLFNNSFNSQHLTHELLYDACNNEYLFLEKDFNEASLNYMLNKNTNILLKSDAENRLTYLLKSNGETKIEVQPSFSNTQLFMPPKSKKKYINNSKIIKSFSAPNLLSFRFSKTSHSILDNVYKESKNIYKMSMSNFSEPVSIDNKIRHSYSLNFFEEELHHRQCNKSNFELPIYSDIHKNLFINHVLNKKSSHETISANSTNSFLLKKHWTSPRSFSSPTQFISPVISTFSTVLEGSSVFLNNNTKTILSNSLLKSTPTNEHFLGFHDIKDKNIWNSIFSKWSKLVHIRYPSTNISENNANFMIIKD
ncbi:hypothetical protein PCK1_001694 [Pneumocystis canis]|nr:hypothetical protein PCK1_001694 [Pneumocystis canis]